MTEVPQLSGGDWQFVVMVGLTLAAAVGVAIFGRAPRRDHLQDFFDDLERRPAGDDEQDWR